MTPTRAGRETTPPTRRWEREAARGVDRGKAGDGVTMGRIGKAYFTDSDQRWDG